MSKVWLILAALCGAVLVEAGSKYVVRQSIQDLSTRKPVRGTGTTPDLCPTCIEFTDQTINELVNIIGNGVVIGGCEELCTLLDEKIPNEVLEVICNMLCDVVGIKEFVDLLEKADLDPIYFCELITVCPINDNGDATIKSLKVIPDNFTRGSEFVASMIFETKNGTGTGEIFWSIDTQDGMPVAVNQIVEARQPGTYNVSLTFVAERHGCGSGPCEEWYTGNYTLHGILCNGECYSKHPHSQVFGAMKAPFYIKKK